jgi:hypothetical protein
VVGICTTIEDVFDFVRRSMCRGKGASGILLGETRGIRRHRKVVDPLLRTLLPNSVSGADPSTVPKVAKDVDPMTASKHGADRLHVLRKKTSE